MARTSAIKTDLIGETVIMTSDESWRHYVRDWIGKRALIRAMHVDPEDGKLDYTLCNQDGELRTFRADVFELAYVKQL